MSEELIEVEIKVPLSTDDFEHIREAILKLGGEYLTNESQQDIYYDHPCRSFRETDEAVRVRKRIPLTREETETIYPLPELAYKGPKMDTKSKTRLELSVSILDNSVVTAILEELGFRTVAKIVKERAIFKYGSATICIDNVEEVGTFMELERLVSAEEEIEPVREELFEIVKNLGLDAMKSVRKSYLELYLEKLSQ
jgi:adenylate cyclase class 2